MKTLKLTLAILLFAIAVQAQTNANFLTAMKKGVSTLESDSLSAQFLVSANYFERIAQAEPKEWLPAYYAGYCNMIAAVIGKQTNDEKDALYDKAMDFAGRADRLSPKNSEVIVLFGYITYMKMAVDPQNRAMTMIAETNKYLDMAVALNPENPRSYFVRGQNIFYTPVAFGGGSTNAKPLLAMASDKFEKETAASPAPAWGKTQCKALLSQCK